MSTFVHKACRVDVYAVPFYFLVDDDIERGGDWLRQQTESPDLYLPSLLQDKTFAGIAFDPRNARGYRVFVVWLKEFEPPDDYGRLAHECVHAAFQMLHFINHRPRLKPRDSEPIAYLVDYLVRCAVTAIEEQAKPKKGR